MFKSSKYRLLGAIFALVGTNLYAQVANPCTSQKNTIEIDGCAKFTFENKDKQLNIAYQKLIKTLATDDKDDITDYREVREILTEAQKNWVKYRDSDCKGKLSLHSTGTIRGWAYFSCLTERTEQRTKELGNWKKL